MTTLQKLSKKELRAKIISKIEEAYNLGYYMGHGWGVAFVGGTYRSIDIFKCPMGCVLLNRTGVGNITFDASRELGTNSFWVNGFLRGYDNPTGELYEIDPSWDTTRIEEHMEFNAGREVGKEIYDYIMNR